MRKILIKTLKIIGLILLIFIVLLALLELDFYQNCMCLTETFPWTGRFAQ